MRNNRIQKGCVLNGSVVIAGRQKKKPRRERRRALFSIRRRGAALTGMTSASRLDTGEGLKGLETTTLMAASYIMRAVRVVMLAVNQRYLRHCRLNEWMSAESRNSGENMETLGGMMI